MKKTSLLDHLVFILVMIGGINWGLLAIFKFNLIVAIFPGVSLLVNFTYILIAFAALYGLVKYVRQHSK